MRYSIIIIFLFSFTTFSQRNSTTKAAMLPKNCIQLDSITFIGQTEITNSMYREFVNAVYDSIVTHLLYDSLPPSQAVKILAVSQRQLKIISPENRAENAKKYSLNYSAYKSLVEYDSLATVIVARNMCYPISARFYRRREIDPAKLIYKWNDSRSIPVYPDTLSWINDYYVKYKDEIDTTIMNDYPTTAFTNMYFWHPVYDNYPVVGLTYQQMCAFCHWHEMEMNKHRMNSGITYQVSIPSERQYTQALQLCYPTYLNKFIGSEFADDLVTYNRSIGDAIPHIHPAYQDMQYYEDAEIASYKARIWSQNNATSPILNLLGGVAEVCENAVSTGEIRVLGGDYYLGILAPEGIQANTLFYKRSLSATQGYSYVGFRILVTTNLKL